MDFTEEQQQQEQLFGTLLGFKTGDRIKTRVKVYTWSRPARYYWRYGKVESIAEPDYFTKEQRLRVMFDGDYYTCTVPASRLVRCRKYARKKV